VVHHEPHVDMELMTINLAAHGLKIRSSLEANGQIQVPKETFLFCFMKKIGTIKLTRMTNPFDKSNNRSRTSDSHFANFFSGDEEGELKVDVYQKDNNIIVKSTVAGAKPEDIDININNDILTVRGKREMDEAVQDKEYLHRECFWGPFSRSIILPCEIQKGRVRAIIKRGVLTIVLPKAVGKKEIRVRELEE